MTPEEIKGFKDYCEKQRYLKRCVWEMDMKAFSEENLKNIQLNIETDSPLPQWAKSVVEQNNMLSRRARIFLLRYHDFKIRQNRLRKAKGLV